MRDIVRIIPERERAYIASAREKYAVDFPTQDFDAACWDVRHLRASTRTSSNPRTYFTRHGTLGDPLPTAYAAVVKSYVVLHRSSITNLNMRVDAARMLWRAIEQRVGERDAAGQFRWDGLVSDDVREAETCMLAAWGAGTVHKTAMQLVGMLDSLARRGLCPRLSVRVRTPRSEDRSRRTLSGAEERLAYRPTDAALQGLVDLFAGRGATGSVVLSDADRIRLALVIVLLTTGLRVGEALTIPDDPLVRRNGDIGLRYWREKPGDNATAAVFWPTAMQAELLIPAVEEVQRLTRDARARARELERDPSRVPPPGGFKWNDELTSAELAALLGCVGKDSVNGPLTGRVPKRMMPGRGRYGGPYALFRVADVMTYLRGERGPLEVLARRDDGTPQLLSDSLFIAFRNTFHDQKGTNTLLVDPIDQQTIGDFLGGRGGVPAVFARYGIREADGSTVELSSHQMRHWLVSAAEEGGASDEDIRRWQRRESDVDIAAYKHMTPDSRVRWAKRAVKDGRLRGPVRDLYFELVERDPTEAEEYLDGAIQAMHITSLGLCIRDFSISPCPYKLNCVKGECGDYLVDPENPQQRRELVQLERRSSRIVLTFEARVADGSGDDLADAWLDDARATRDGARRALAAEVRPGERLARPFQGQPSRFAPVDTLPAPG